MRPEKSITIPIGEVHRIVYDGSLNWTLDHAIIGEKGGVVWKTRGFYGSLALAAGRVLEGRLLVACKEQFPKVGVFQAKTLVDVLKVEGQRIADACSRVCSKCHEPIEADAS